MMPHNTEILDQIAVVVRRHIGDQAFPLSEVTQLGAAPGWDSVKTVDILLDCEDLFAVQLSAKDIDGLISIGDLVAAINRRLEV